MKGNEISNETLINFGYNVKQLGINKPLHDNFSYPLNSSKSHNKNSDFIDIQHLNYSRTDNIIRKLSLPDNRQIHFIYSTTDNSITANVVAKNGDVVVVKTENLPKELLQLKSPEAFDKFLQHAHTQVSILSDGEAKLYIRQKLYGGGQNEQNAIIHEFAQKHALDEYNTGFVLTEIRNRLNEEPTYTSKQTIKNLYIIWFAGVYAMDSYNTKTAIQRCTDIFKEALHEDSKNLLKKLHTNYFQSNFCMDTANIETLAYSNSVLFDNLQVLQPPIILPIISSPVINNYPTITNIINTSSNLEGDQVKQSQLINDYLKIYKMDHYNTRNLLNNVLFGYATVLSKQIIKSNFINNFIEYCANNLNESNVQIGINTTIELFKEPLGNEPAKTMLKSAYVKWFLRKDSGYVMDEKNTSIAVNTCIDLFKEPLVDEPAKFMLKHAFIYWFTDDSRYVGMDEENTPFAIKVCADIFKEQLGKEPAKLLLEEKYVIYFLNKYILDSTNREILKNRYWNMFNETLVNYDFNETLVNYDSRISQVVFRSHDSDLIGYGEKLGIGISAGENYATLRNYIIKYGSQSDEMTKEFIKLSFEEYFIDGCFKNVKSAYDPTNLSFADHLISIFKIAIDKKLSVGSIVLDPAYICFKGIYDKIAKYYIPDLSKELKSMYEFNSLSNDSKSFNGGTHKESGNTNTNNSSTSQISWGFGGSVTYAPSTSFKTKGSKY